jgi:hypothetical protein
MNSAVNYGCDTVNTKQAKGRAPDARPADPQMVAGVRFELTTFGQRVPVIFPGLEGKRQPDSSGREIETKKKAGRLMPGQQILKWLRGSDLN